MHVFVWMHDEIWSSPRKPFRQCAHLYAVRCDVTAPCVACPGAFSQPVHSAEHPARPRGSGGALPGR